ncbi:hypothetical protein PROFUN_14938 [Planoprotostelium fungivorum]|uniref:Uncharacterized protein n=1 Tax=Planoprotostelium fungivorum TaxID=1890364 RepID=A0A2P6MYB8_9EUKA|nr:hypothetical protein PROFUN_14938 [Planoprotostelium fungivorum]
MVVINEVFQPCFLPPIVRPFLPPGRMPSKMLDQPKEPLCPQGLYGALRASQALARIAAVEGALVAEIRQLRQTIQAVRRTMPARVVRCWDIAVRPVAWATLKCCSFLISLLGAVASIYQLMTADDAPNKLQSQVPQHSNDEQKD